MTWFEFLNSFCCQPLLQGLLGIRGLNFCPSLQKIARSKVLKLLISVAWRCGTYFPLSVQRKAGKSIRCGSLLDRFSGFSPVWGE
ncbi:MAG: hypothetical protein QRY16_20030 [Enterobacterales bacterium endosymbiont of Blomia tropicalis]|uniref:hypothetical protein n=1 Tax=Mixta mediterraneensis TaxID=2758443 RepID=UPI0025A796CF|nr:hypothetical protein [Mixta mediterraneensis]MDL4915969.1 hypothetical protein [Mixta mediterraneensis]